MKSYLHRPSNLKSSDGLSNANTMSQKQSQGMTKMCNYNP